MLIRLPFTVKSMHAISKYTTCIFTVKMCKYVFRRTMFEVGLSITGKLEDELAFHHFFCVDGVLCLCGSLLYCFYQATVAGKAKFEILCHHVVFHCAREIFSIHFMVTYRFLLAAILTIYDLMTEGLGFVTVNKIPCCNVCSIVTLLFYSKVAS